MTRDIYTLLRKKFPENAYALMAEVSNGAGFNRSRSADYMIMGLWPSRGLNLNGIELKASRSDWLRELKNPNKAESIFQYCDKFWLLTDGENIAKLEEIPETWGWMLIKGNRIFIKKEAPKLEPKPITRSFLASMLKRASSKDDFIRRSEIQDKLDIAAEQGKRASKYETQILKAKNTDLNKVLEEFRVETGITLTTRSWGNYTTRNIGKAVKFIQDGGTENIEKQLLGLESTATIVLDRIKKGLESIKNK